jgi:hypothetical protein
MVFVAGRTISSQAEAVICEKDNKQDKRGKVLHSEGAFKLHTEDSTDAKLGVGEAKRRKPDCTAPQCDNRSTDVRRYTGYQCPKKEETVSRVSVGGSAHAGLILGVSCLCPTLPP